MGIILSAGASGTCDSNILIHLTNTNSPDHRAAEFALKELEQVGTELLYTSQNIAEFWNVCTRIGPGGIFLSIEETSRRLAMVEARFIFLPELPRAAEIFKDILRRYRVRGVQVHDARLASVMLASGVSEILTFDRDDFKRYTELTIIHPDDLLP